MENKFTIISTEKYGKQKELYHLHPPLQ